MELVLVAQDERLAEAWESAFAGVPDVSVARGSIFEQRADALVSPANSFGFMDGGIDAAYVDRFGDHLQPRLRRTIVDDHHGELLVGNAVIVPTDHAQHPYLIAAPTMRVPMALPPDTIAPYLATRAVLLLAAHGVFRGGDLAGRPLATAISRIAFPGMGTGVGRVPAEISARQMRAAFDDVRRAPRRLPRSWAEASEAHQLLYTDKPVRLQY